MNLIERILGYLGGRDAVLEAPSLADARIHAQRTITRTVHFGMELRESELNIVEHSALVAMISQKLGEKMNISEPDAYVLQTAAELHEVGMYGIPPELLLQTEPYTPEDLEVVRAQAKVSAQLAGLMHGPRVARLIERQYADYDALSEADSDPDGLLAGILRVSDVIAAVTSPRPYQAALSAHERGTMLKSGSGSRFHPLAVEYALTGRLDESDSEIARTT